MFVCLCVCVLIHGISLVISYKPPSLKNVHILSVFKHAGYNPFFWLFSLSLFVCVSCCTHKCKIIQKCLLLQAGTNILWMMSFLFFTPLLFVPWEKCIHIYAEIPQIISNFMNKKLCQIFLELKINNRI